MTKEKAKSDTKHAKENKGITNRADAIYPVTTPSMIGCREDGKLRIILQTPDTANYIGYAWAQYKAKSVRVLTPVGEPYFGGSVLEIWMLPNVYAWIDFAETGDLNTTHSRIQRSEARRSTTRTSRSWNAIRCRKPSSWTPT